MRNYFKYIICFLFIAFSTYSEAQIVTDTESIMSNIELLNQKIKTLSININSLKSNLKSFNKDINKMIADNNSNHLEISTKLINLIQEFELINVDYQATLKQLLLFKSENVIQSNLIKQNNDEILLISNNLLKLVLRLTNIENSFAKLPEIFTNSNAIPEFCPNFSLIKFITFGNNELNVEPGYSIGINYIFQSNFFLYGECTYPFALTLSTSQNRITGNISEKWKAQVYSIGIGYQNKFSQLSSFNYIISGGLFYGSLSYDKFANTNLGLDRNNTQGTNTFGPNIKLGITYNQFSLKNPLELYLHFNNLISINNIVLKTDINNKFDLGAYLFSVSLGINFWFW